MMLTTLLISGLASFAQPARVAPPPPAPRGLTAATQTIDRRAFEQGLLESSGGPVFAAIRRHFPEDSVLLIDRFYALYTSSRGNITASMQAAIAEMERYGQSKMHLIVNAPTADLVELNRRILAAMRVLRGRNVEACARMATGEGGLSPRDALNMDFHEMEQLSVGLIETAGIGSRSPEIPGRGQANQNHVVAWMLEMERLDPDGDLRSLIEDEARLRAATPAQKCDIGILMHQAIAAMEPEPAASLFAFLVAEGVRQGQPARR